VAVEVPEPGGIVEQIDREPIMLVRAWSVVRGMSPSSSALINPATGETIGEVPDTDVADVAGAVARARGAADQWGTATPSERARVLLALADLIERDADALAALEVAETGKPWTVMREGELPFAVDNLRFFASSARDTHGTGAGRVQRRATPRCWSGTPRRRRRADHAVELPAHHGDLEDRRRPRRRLHRGAQAGPGTPLTTLASPNSPSRPACPTASSTVVTGDAEVGEALVTDPARRHDHLTGSTATGKSIMGKLAATASSACTSSSAARRRCWCSTTPTSNRRAAAAFAATYNTGQDCTAATRLYVEPRSAERAVEAVAEAMRDP
jgi:betaine-aldehyde dehydrogenase